MKVRQVATKRVDSIGFSTRTQKETYRRTDERNTHIPGTKSNSRAKQQTKHPLLIGEYLIDILTSAEFLKLR